MNIRSNVLLAQYTTFRIGGPAKFFCSVTNEAELLEAVVFANSKNIDFFVLGGGSNLLISDNGFSGLVIKNDIKGKDFGPEDNNLVQVSIGAGENWDDIVGEMVKNNLQGIENLSAIPGTVGATPVQNIGAYGAEIKDVLVSVKVLDTTRLEYIELFNKDCEFSYRDSIFKHQKGRYIVTKVNLQLIKDGQTNIDYRDLREYFAKKNKIDKPSIQEVRDAVIFIRSNKLPDWKKMPTAGSFFKNPVISKEYLKELIKKYPDLPNFPTNDDKIKISLGWILEKVCNAKGFCIGNVCTYEKQALVVVAKPESTSVEVINFAKELSRQVKDKTGIEIEREVEYV